MAGACRQGRKKQDMKRGKKTGRVPVFTATTVIAVFTAITLLCACGKEGEIPEEPENVTEAVTEADFPEEDPVAPQQIEVVIENAGASKETPAEPETSATELAIGVKYAMAEVNVRVSPGTDAEKAGMLSENQEVPYIEDDGEWTKIVFDGKVCYAASRYLTDDKAWREHLLTKNGYKNGDPVSMDPSWEYAGFSEIHSDSATMYVAKANRKNIVVGVNAGHGTSGGSNVKTWCHPDQTPKVTGGTTEAGATKAVAVSSGMNFSDGTPEAKVTLREAMMLKELLLANGYDVLMIRETDDAQLDNVARTVICNNAADCHIAIHWDGDGLTYDKGCFYMSVPDGIKYLPSVASTWKESERLGDSLIAGLSEKGCKIYSSGNMVMDLTQTSYSTVPSIDIELGNQSSDHSDAALSQLAEGLLRGVNRFFGAE